MEQTIRIKDFMGEHTKAATAFSVEETKNEEDFAEDVVKGNEEDSDVQVMYVDVDEVIIPQITDTHGRISDIVESIELDTGITAVPFEMANISPEIVRLQRHDIFKLGNVFYAMSKNPREKVIKQYVQRIIKTLSTGLPFTENLMVSVAYNDKVYRTLALSQVEWSIVLSKFRVYKQKLRIRNGDTLIMEIMPERVRNQ